MQKSKIWSIKIIRNLDAILQPYECISYLPAYLILLRASLHGERFDHVHLDTRRSMDTHGVDADMYNV